MDSPPENFDQLRRLLALKRHEQPPPGYFHGFSREVVIRIRAGEGRDSAGWEQVSWEAPWLQRLWQSLSVRPAWSGALSAAACALVIGGILYAERLEMPSYVENVSGQTEMVLPASAQALFNQPVAVQSAATIFSTNSLAQPGIPGGLFGSPGIAPQHVARPFLGN